MNLRFAACILATGLAYGVTAQAQPAPEPTPSPNTLPPAEPSPPSPDDPAAPTAHAPLSTESPEELPPALAPAQKAPEAAKPVPVVTADEKGFALKAPGDPSPFVLKFKLVAQLDARKFFDKDYIRNDAMYARRLRPYLEGTVLNLVDYRLLVDFAPSASGAAQAVVFDAYADVHPVPWLRVRYGKIKTPIGLERLQSDPDLPWIERSLTAALAPDRDIGLLVWGDVAGGFVNYSVGVFNGAADSTNGDGDNGVHKDLAGRLLIQPFKPKSLEQLGHLGVAIAGTYGKRDGTASAPGLGSLRTPGRLEFFKYRAPTAPVMANGMTVDPTTITAFARGEHTRINPELFYYYGGLGLVAEAIWSRQEIHIGDRSAKLNHRAWHATLSYVLWGKNGLDGATPSERWDPSAGHLGALELAARYHRLDIDEDAFPDFADPNTAASRAHGFGFATNWILSRNFRLALDFESVRFKGGGAMGSDKKTESVLLGRFQVVL